MKVSCFAIFALSACLGNAIPHGSNHRHQQFHKRALITAIVTDIVTVTDYNAVIWVNQGGKIVKTEHRSPATTTTTSASTVTIPSTSATQTSPASNVQPNEESRLGSEEFESSDIDNRTPDITTSSTSTSSSPSEAIPSASPVDKDSSHSDENNYGDNLTGLGVAYDAYTGSGCRPTLDSDFAFLASKGASMIRVYDVCFAEAANAAQAHNLKLMIGLTSFTDFDINLSKLSDAITSTSAGWPIVDTVFIGNELVNKGLASSSDVAGKVSYARGILKTKGFAGNVVTVDTWTAMRNDATICSTSDYCAANAHAFFDGNTLPDGAGPFVRMAQKAVADKANGKRVVITETGWPHAGAPMGVAVPSVDNQHAAMASIVKEFASSANDIFLFMAYDATWKTNAPEIERNFGIFDAGHYAGVP